jgi:hypothetical protein
LVLYHMRTESGTFREVTNGATELNWGSD